MTHQKWNSKLMSHNNSMDQTFIFDKNLVKKLTAGFQK